MSDFKRAEDGLLKDNRLVALQCMMHVGKAQEEEHSCRLALRQPQVCIVRHFISVASAYEGGLPVPPLPSHFPSVSVWSVTPCELTRGADAAEISKKFKL